MVAVPQAAPLFTQPRVAVLQSLRAVAPAAPTEHDIYVHCPPMKACVVGATSGSKPTPLPKPKAAAAHSDDPATMVI